MNSGDVRRVLKVARTLGIAVGAGVRDRMTTATVGLAMLRTDSDLDLVEGGGDRRLRPADRRDRRRQGRCGCLVHCVRSHRLVADSLTPAVRAQVDRYEALVAEFAASNAEILGLADELAAGTIDRVMAKSDLELGIEAVLRGLGPR